MAKKKNKWFYTLAVLFVWKVISTLCIPFAVIDRKERVYHPSHSESTLSLSHGWLWHGWNYLAEGNHGATGLERLV